jgi:hypothetical protein
VSAGRRFGAPRRGIALLSAISLLSLLALLIAGAFVGGRFTRRAARLAELDVRLTSAIDYAITTTLGAWESLNLPGLALGGTQTTTVTSPSVTPVAVVISVTRLPASVFWLVADATLVGDETAARRVNLVVRTPVSLIAAAAPIVSRGDVEVGAGVQFVPDTAHDASCSASVPVHIAVAPGAQAHGALDGVHVETRPGAADSTTYLVTSTGWSASNQASGVIFVTGDTTIMGGSAQGVLLVQGHLRIDGPFTFSGVIVARGGVDVVRGGAAIDGAVLSFAPAPGNTVQLSNVTLRASACAVTHALEAALAPRPVRERAWAELF